MCINLLNIANVLWSRSHTIFSVFYTQKYCNTGKHITHPNGRTSQWTISSCHYNVLLLGHSWVFEQKHMILISNLDTKFSGISWVQKHLLKYLLPAATCRLKQWDALKPDSGNKMNVLHLCLDPHTTIEYGLAWWWDEDELKWTVKNCNERLPWVFVNVDLVKAHLRHPIAYF